MSILQKKAGLPTVGQRSAVAQPMGGKAEGKGERRWNLNTILLGVVIVLLLVVMCRQGGADARSYRYSTFMIGAGEMPAELTKEQRRLGANVRITWLDVSKKIPEGWEYVGVLSIDTAGNTWHMIRKPKD
ncbi:MAG: hypothetical protein IJY72_04830 [Akkermansia sp.]|nr:hypothetical protein [Akkermansia sp.]